MTRSHAAWVVTLSMSVLLLTGASRARAQTVDQTALEQMFGEPVTMSATGEPQRASDVPAEMIIITADDIRRSGADTIPDMLRFVPGVDVRSYGTQDAAVGIRGYDTALNPRVLVLLDGRQVYQDDYGLTVWSLIPVTISEIRQIEIIKGPSAALYGFNAVSGVINIVTYDPLRDRLNAVRVDGGTQNRAYGEAVATAQVAGRLGIRLSAKGFRSSEFPDDSDQVTREQPHSGMIAADLRMQVASNIEWDVSGSLSSVDSDYYIDLGFYLPVGFKANSLRSRVTADTTFGVMQMDAYRNENRTSENGVFYTSWRQDVTVLQASDLLKFGNQRLRVAAEYRDNSASSLSAFGGRLGYTNFAGSLMWEWRVVPWLSTTNAIRADNLSLGHQGAQFIVPGRSEFYHSVGILEPSFNSGIVARFTDYDTVRLTAARAVQLPSLLDFGFSTSFGPAIVAGDVDLQPSAVMNYEIDYDHVLHSLGSTLRLAIFAQHSDSSIGSPFGSGIVVLPGGRPAFLARNFGGSSEGGGEIGLKGSSDLGLRWNVSYALAAVHDTSPGSLMGGAPSVSYQRQTPVHSIIGGGGYSRGRLELDGQLRWQSHFEDYTGDAATGLFGNKRIDNYVTADSRIGYRITKQATISLLVQQLNRQSLAESAGAAVARRFIASVKAWF